VIFSLGGNIDVIGPITRIPVIGWLYRILALPGTGIGIAWGIFLTVASGLLAILIVRSRTAAAGLGKLTVGGTSAALPIIGRILIAALFIWLGGDSWTSYIGVLNLVALPFDLAIRGILNSRGRAGLAIVPALNMPLFPPYLLQVAVAAYCLAYRGARREEGIVIGIARHALAYLPIEVTDRVGDIRRIERDWVLREYGNRPIIWNPVREGNPHLLICGASGMGKSTLMYYLIVKLLMRGYPVTILDPLGQYAKFAKMLELVLKKREYRGLISKVFLVRDPERARKGWAGCRVYGVTESGINVLEPVVGEPKIQIAEDLSYALAIVERQTPGATQHYLLTTSAVKLMGSNKGAKLSQLADLLERAGKRLLEMRRMRAYEAAMNLAMRIRLLSRYLEPDGEPLKPRMLEAKPGDEKNGKWGELVVVDLSGIHDDDTRRITIELLLRKLRLYISKRPLAPTSKPWFIVVDEAWTLMRSNSEYRSVVNEMIREVRNRGVAMILLTQRAGDVDKDALANVGTKIYLKLGEESDVEDLVQYTGCHLLREIIHQMDKHEGLILKRFAGVGRVGRASMYRAGADMMLVGRIAHLYPPEKPWKDAEKIIDEAKERAERRIEELTKTVEADELLQVAAAQTSNAATVSAASQPSDVRKRVEGRDSATGCEERVREPSKPSPDVAATTKKSPVKKPMTIASTKRFARVTIAVGKLAEIIKEVGDQGVESTPPDKLAILVSHISRRCDRDTLPLSDPIASTLLRMGLAKRSGNEVILQRQITSLEKRMIRRGGPEIIDLLDMVRRSTCPNCLTILDLNRFCPSCGRRWEM